MSRVFASIDVFQILLVSLLLLTVQIKQSQCNASSEFDDTQWNWMEAITIANAVNESEIITVQMDKSTEVSIIIRNLNKQLLLAHNATVHIVGGSESILSVSGWIPVDEIDASNTWAGNVTFDAIFIGRANVFVRVLHAGNGIRDSSFRLPVTIIRENRMIDKIFIASVIALTAILYVNFGAALDLQKVRGALARPIGPAIAFFCHFVVLPLSAYFLGIFLFPKNVEMQLGLFFTGSSPAGGASNMWTVLLGGNLDLSITMSTTSTLAAFGMMPLWIFTLGRTIFDRAELGVPYRKISEYVFILIIPVAVGLLVQRKLPGLAKLLVRILKSLSALFIIFIVVFAIITNLYLFKLFTWQILLGGMLLPFIGYFVGWLVAIIFRQNYEDRLAIAIEAGIQNTGISIFILRLALNQPEADLTTVVPVAVAIMTPFPLMAYYLCYKGREIARRYRTRDYPIETKTQLTQQSSLPY